MNTQASRVQVLQQRLISHAAILLDISSKFASNAAGHPCFQAIIAFRNGSCCQLRRSSWCREPRYFIHKLRIVLKELNETDVWLQLLVQSSLLSPEKMSAIVAENHELCGIIAASIRTAGGFERS
jgi:hypothetical protein